MKKFITKTFLLLLPILLICVSAELLIREIPNDYSFKRNYLDKNSHDIEVLFLGSSHTYYGINPDYISEKTFNAAHISQSIDYDFEILKKYESKWGQLKYIVIPMDYFTLFSKISNGNETWRTKNYVIYYGINIEGNLRDNFEILSFKSDVTLRRILAYYISNKPSLTSSNLGFGQFGIESQDLKKSGETAARRHKMSSEINFIDNQKVVREIIAFASREDAKVVFYSSPAYHTYVSQLDKNQLEMTSETVKDFVSNNSNCSYFNFLEDSSFAANDFSDADHLNESGAKKLSLKFRNILEDDQ